MKRQTNITDPQITEFLRQGFVLREGPHLWVSESLGSVLDALKTQEISVVCSDFYDLKKGVSFKDVKAHQVSLGQFQEVLQDFLERLLSSTGLPKRSWTVANRSHFSQSFVSIQNKIQSGTLKKAVPFVGEESVGSVTCTEKAHWLLKALGAPEHLFFFGAWNSDQGVIGVTPEVLFHRQEKVFESMALAGTLPKSLGLEKTALLRDLKEINEHSFVVEDIEKKLRRLGSVGVQGPQIVELPHLFHLQTRLQVLLQSVKSGLEYVQLLHPTPALGIFPQEAGLDWFRTLPEQETRGMFGGPALFDFQNSSLALVMIRSLFWDSNFLRLAAGCGIVAESVEEKEWMEIQQKLKSIKDIFGIE